MFFSDSWISKKPMEDIEGRICYAKVKTRTGLKHYYHYVNTDINGMLLKTAMMCQEYERRRWQDCI